MRVRSKGTGVATFSNWTNNAIVAYVAPNYLFRLGPKMYLIFGSAGLIMASFAFFFIPETKGKSLEEMDQVFGKKLVKNDKKV